MLRVGSGSFAALEGLAKKDADGEEEEAGFVWLRIKWKFLSHFGSVPRVAMEETWMTMLGGVGGVGVREGTVERICWRPGQPNDVWREDFVVVGFWREGALPRNAARIDVKS